jgi:hypothetical protein
LTVDAYVSNLCTKRLHKQISEVPDTLAVKQPLHADYIFGADEIEGSLRSIWCELAHIKWAND